MRQRFGFRQRLGHLESHPERGDWWGSQIRCVWMSAFWFGSLKSNAVQCSDCSPYSFGRRWSMKYRLYSRHRKTVFLEERGKKGLPKGQVSIGGFMWPRSLGKSMSWSSCLGSHVKLSRSWQALHLGSGLGSPHVWQWPKTLALWASGASLSAVLKTIFLEPGRFDSMRLRKSLTSVRIASEA